MNEIILTSCDVISKIKQNSSDMNEIILAPCDAGYVQSCTGFFLLRLTILAALKLTRANAQNIIFVAEIWEKKLNIINAEIWENNAKI
jgi:hypothetical protein